METLTRKEVRSEVIGLGDTGRVEVPFGQVSALLDTVAVEKVDLYTPRASLDGVTMEKVPHVGIATKTSGRILNVTKPSYRIHQYDDVLVESARELVQVSDGAAFVNAAGFTNWGGSAFVQVTLREGVSVAGRDGSGPEIYSHAMFAASHGGAFATQARFGMERLWCSNQIPGLVAKGAMMRVRHTSRSDLRLNVLRGLLASLYAQQASMLDEARKLAAQPVTLAQAEAVWAVEDAFPVARPGEDAPHASAVTRWESRREAFLGHWATDPYTGTAWGLYQAVNGFRQHSAATRLDRDGRTVDRVLTGALAKADRATLATIRGLVSAN